MTAKKKYKDFESALARLEEITDLLESGDQSLEDSIDIYTEGLEIARFCNEKLSEAGQKIKMITEKDGAIVEEEFDAASGAEDAG
ncbi:MAG: exodeoxyribonuclease VII small subunit [Candidatus Zixiibacteriota bacterium]